MYDASTLGNGRYSIRNPSGAPIAVDVFIGGHGGQNAWIRQETVNTPVLFDDLTANNHIVVQLWFTNTGWFGAPKGQKWGFKTQANHVATALKALHDMLAVPIVVPMQVAGGSGGCAAISYSISFYDIDQYLSRAVLISGPPFAAIDEGCTQVAGWQYAGDATSLTDTANGEQNPLTQPCTLHSTDPAWVAWWEQDSVEVGGRYFYPTTQIDFIEGAKDNQQEIKSRENAFFGLIRDSGQTLLSFALFSDMQHEVQKSATAMQYLGSVLKAVTAAPTATPTPSPTDTPTPTPTATPTDTPTPAPTATPTDTPTPAPTATPTDTPTPTPTATATATPTPSPTPTPTPTILVTLQTNPGGLAFTVDGTTYSSTQNFSWARGSSRTIATTSPQSGGTGVQYLWTNWSDQGLISHTIAPQYNITYTATFRTQYYLTMNHGAGGTVNATSGWRNSGTAVSISATPTNTTSVSYTFTSWTGTGTGSYSGTNNPASITMNAAITESAAFTQNPVQVTVQTSPSAPTFTVDGSPYTAAQSFSWQPGSSHTIATTSPQSDGTGVQYVWKSWSDNGSMSHTVAPTTNKTYTATFATQYYLTIVAGVGGKVSPSSGWRNSGAAVSITATPAAGYTFSNWTGSGTGSYTGSTNPNSVTMSGPITETAAFTH